MRNHQLLLSLLGLGSLVVKAGKREVPDWGPWLPLPEGDRWPLIRIWWMSLQRWR